MQERRGVGGLERWEVNKSEAARRRRAGGQGGETTGRAEERLSVSAGGKNTRADRKQGKLREQQAALMKTDGQGRQTGRRP